MSVPFPAPDGPVTTKTGRQGTAELRTVVEELDELGPLPLGEAADRLRLTYPAWFRRRAALTRPNFGTAMSMSKTFAVETYSGGSSGMPSMLSSPAFRSRLSCARRTQRRSPVAAPPSSGRGARRRLRVRLRCDHEPVESTKVPSVVKQERFT
jgi:hypothetical protein